MKTSLLAFLLFAFTGLSAQKIEPDQVPAAISTSFHKEFSDAKDETWMKEAGDGYTVYFIYGEAKRKGVVKFNGNGRWYERDLEIAYTDLSGEIIAALKKDFDGFSPKTITQFESSSKGIYYQVELLKGRQSDDLKEYYSLEFAADGRLLKNSGKQMVKE